MSELFYSSGILSYHKSEKSGGLKLILEVDQGIANYYRKLIPKTYPKINPQMYAAHISVVRHENPNLEFWGKYEGELVEFVYSNIIKNGEIYFWLDCYSLRLEEIRKELGLPFEPLHPSHEFYKFVPEPYSRTFHCTLGNLKTQN